MKSLLRILPLIFPLAAHAAGIATPDAGTILQQIRPDSAPETSKKGTGLVIEQKAGAELPPSVPFLVKVIRITGNSAIETSSLHTLVMDAEGQDITLAKLGELAARITDYYHTHGYPLARAILPAQTIRDGMVEIQVIEARYGVIKLDNQSRVNDSLLEATLAVLQSDQVIEQSALDRSLLLLADVPGIVTGATLRPGEKVGSSDLLVTASPGSRAVGSATLDNYGNKYTGKARAGGTLNIFNPLHHGDVLSASGMSSGSGMNYGRISYESLLNGTGSRMGGALSALHYILGDELESMNAHGTAQVKSLWGKHPLMTGRKAHIFGQLQYDRKQLRDHIDAGELKNDRHINNWTASLYGDFHDTFMSGGNNTWSLGWTSGQVGFDDEAAQWSDAATAKTRGRFSKWTLNFSRLQGLSEGSAIFFSFTGQWANTNLDSAEKMVAGGPYTVRAYDMGAVSGDTGKLGSVELRHALSKYGFGHWTASAFVDSEHVKVNKNAWVEGANSATLKGAGVGLYWLGWNSWSARIYLAKPIGSVPDLLGASRRSTRAWGEIERGF